MEGVAETREMVLRDRRVLLSLMRLQAFLSTVNVGIYQYITYDVKCNVMCHDQSVISAYNL